MKEEELNLINRLEGYSLRSGYALHCHRAAALLRSHVAEIQRLNTLLSTADALIQEADAELASIRLALPDIESLKK